MSTLYLCLLWCDVWTWTVLWRWRWIKWVLPTPTQHPSQNIDKYTENAARTVAVLSTERGKMAHGERRWWKKSANRRSHHPILWNTSCHESHIRKSCRGSSWTQYSTNFRCVESIQITLLIINCHIFRLFFADFWSSILPLDLAYSTFYYCLWPVFFSSVCCVWHF